jgi:hypothetical protein
MAWWCLASSCDIFQLDDDDDDHPGYSDRVKSGWRSGMISTLEAREHAGGQILILMPRRIHRAPQLGGRLGIPALGPHAMGPRGPEARAHLSGLPQMGKPSAPMRGGQASRAASGGEHGGAAPKQFVFVDHLAARRVLGNKSLHAAARMA